MHSIPLVFLRGMFFLGAGRRIFWAVPAQFRRLLAPAGGLFPCDTGYLDSTSHIQHVAGLERSFGGIGGGIRGRAKT